MIRRTDQGTAVILSSMCVHCMNGKQDSHASSAMVYPTISIEVSVFNELACWLTT